MLKNLGKSLENQLGKMLINHWIPEKIHENPFVKPLRKRRPGTTRLDQLNEAPLWMETDWKHRRNGIKYELFVRILLKLVKRVFELALTYFTRHLQHFPWMFQVPKSFTNQTIHVTPVAPRSTFFWAMGYVELKHVTIKHVTSFHGISYDENMNEYD